MGLEALFEIGKAFGEAFGAFSGVGAVLVATGLVILLVIGVGLGINYLIKLLKQVPRMSVWEFIKFTVIFAIALIVVGIIIP